MLRFEATVHNTKELRCRRSLDHFGEIITRLAGMAERFATTLDCADIGFLPDGVLDQLPLPSQLGATRTGGIDLNKPRIRAALSAALALAPAPGGFTVAEFTAKVRAMTGHNRYTTRQAAYDLRKLRGKGLVHKPGRTRRYHVPTGAGPHHRRHADTAGPGHRPHPRRDPQPAHGTQTRHLDPLGDRPARFTLFGTASVRCSRTRRRADCRPAAGARTLWCCPVARAGQAATRVPAPDGRRGPAGRAGTDRWH